MKKLLIILSFFFIVINSFSQTYQVNTKDSTLFTPSTKAGAILYVKGIMYADTFRIVPRDTTWKPSRIGTATYWNSTLYIWSGVLWSAIQGGGGGSNQPLVWGIGFVPTAPYDGSAPVTANIDTVNLIATINDLNVITGVDTVTYLVDSIVCSSSAVTVGTSYLVCPSPTGGDTLATHANQIVTRIGGVLNYQTPLNGQQLNTARPIAYYRYSGTYPTGVWVSQNKAVLVGYSNYGGKLQIGTSNKKAVGIGVNKKDVITLDTSGNTKFPQIFPTSSANLAYIDSATHILKTTPVTQLIAGAGIRIGSSVAADTIVNTGSSSSGTLQQSFDNSITAGDDPVLNGHLLSNLDIDSVADGNWTGRDGVTNISQQSDGISKGSLTVSSNGSSSISSKVEGAGLSASTVITKLSDSSVNISANSLYIRKAQGSQHVKVVISSPDTLLTTPQWVYVPDNDTIKKYPFPSGSSGITALTGDVTASGTGSVASTLATVNSNVGTFGDATHTGQFTVNAKGLITGGSSVAITGFQPQLSGTGYLKFSGTTPSYVTQIPLTTDVTGILPVPSGGTGTATPSLVAGTNVTITGSFPNQTINASGGGSSYNPIYYSSLFGVDSTGATDATTALQNLINMVVTNGGGKIVLQGKPVKIAGSIDATCNCQIYIPTTAFTVPLIIEGESGGLFGNQPNTPFYSDTSKFKTTIYSTYAGTASATTPETSIFGFKAVSLVAASFRNTNLVVKNNPNGFGPEIGGINASLDAQFGGFHNVSYTIDTPFVKATLPRREIFGFATPDNSLGNNYELDNSAAQNVKWGFVVGEHVQADNINTTGCYYGLGIKAGYHSSIITRYTSQWNVNGAAYYYNQSTSPMPDFTILDFDQEYGTGNTGKYYNTIYSVVDTLNILKGAIYYSSITQGIGSDSSKFLLNGGGNLNTYILGHGKFFVADRTNAVTKANIFSGQNTFNVFQRFTGNLYANKIGIGDSSFTKSFSLKSAADYDAVIQNTSSTGIGGLKVINDAGWGGSVTGYGSAGGGTTSRNNLLLTADSSLLLIGGGNIIGLRVQYDGKVKLNESIYLPTSIAASGGFLYNNTGSSTAFGFPQWQFQAASSNVYELNNVAIGTTTASNPLTVSGASSGLVKITNTSATSFADINLANSAGVTAQFFKCGASYGGYKNLQASDFGFDNNSVGNISVLNDNASGNFNVATGAHSSADWTITSAGYEQLNRTPVTNSETNPAILIRNASTGNVEQRKMAIGQTTLVAGTKAITITGLTTSSIAQVTFVSIGGTVTTTWQYAGVCTSNTLTITALTNAGSTDATDTSILNYTVWF